MMIVQSDKQQVKRSLLGIGVLAGALSLGLFIGCGDEDVDSSGTGLSDEFMRSILVDWTDFGLQQYESTLAGSVTLIEASKILCESLESTSDAGMAGAGGREALVLAQEAYLEMREPWIRSRIFSFGPEVDVRERYRAKIDYRPTEYEQLEKYLNEGDIKDPVQTGAPFRGFPAVEYLLFQEGAMDEPAACEYLSLVAADLRLNLDELHSAWSIDGGNYVSTLVDPTEEGDFETRYDAVSGLVNRMGYLIENIRDLDLRNPLGDGADSVQLVEVNGLLSKTSLAQMEWALDTLELLFLGEEGTQGVNDYGSAIDVNLEPLFKELLADSREKLAAINAPFADALYEDREGVEELSDSLLKLQQFYQVDVIGQLGLRVFFSDADGDQ